MFRPTAIVAALLLAVAVHAQPALVPLGVTDLFTFTQPDVGYQLDGKTPVSLGHGWTGFDPTSGVYFTPENTPEQLSQVFMHCPWVAGPGVSFADYALKLPATTHIALAFDIGLRPGAAKSDGVTYRVMADGKLVFEKHATWQEFRAFRADLSAFAGKSITLRLEVDPGPARNTTDDWSLWRDVQILAGTDEQVAAAKAKAAAEVARQREIDLRRGEALGAASLVPLSSHDTTSPQPSVLTETTTTAEMTGNVCTFRCVGDETIEYRYDAGVGPLDGLSVTVNGKPLRPSVFSGGPVVHLDGRDFAIPTPLLRVERLSARLTGLRLTCEYRYTNPETGSSAQLWITFWPDGKSLDLEVFGEAAGQFSGFAAHPSGGRNIGTPFALGATIWRKEGVYASSIIDLMHSEASGIGNGDQAVYTPLTVGTRNAMHDTFFLTVTSRYEESLPNIAHKPSPFLAELSHRVVLDGWGGTFGENEQWLKDMAVYGVNNFLMIKHIWQRDGYDHTYPDTMPANAEMGGDKGLLELSLTAQKLGHRFCVHENYYDYYPNAESYKATDRCLDPQGKPVFGWDNGSVHAFILKPSKLMDYVREFTPEIHKRYQCNAAYHDIMPTWNEDFDADVPNAGKIRYTHEQTQALCDYDRTIFGGPVVFEAADPNMAGVYDGGCNHGVDNYRTPVAVAAELLKVHAKMANHGFGYYERWLPWGYGPGWSTYVMTNRELDKYRAYTVAFGRVGFIGQQLMQDPHGVVREYHLMQAFGRAYTGHLVSRIRYEVGGRFVDAGTALRYGELTRLNVEYRGGQSVYVNLAAQPWRVGDHLLPQYGVLTAGTRSEASTALRDGQISDYARYDNTTYIDARSQQWLPPTPPPPITPSVAKFEAVGGKEFRLSVNWKVERKLDRDYTAFWHFISAGIAFQSDHAPAQPTSTWQIGQTVTDGPIQFAVPDNATVMSYDVMVGLYDKSGRVPLVRGADAVTIGKLIVERDGAVAKSVRFEPATAVQPGADKAPYLEGANTARKVIDFGELSTNGAVVAKRTGGTLEIVPVPAGTQMTIGIAGDVTGIAALDAAGKKREAPQTSRHDGKTWFTASAGAMKYVVTMK
jgi:hypothetical protein